MTPDQVRAELAGELPPALLVLGPGAWDVVSCRPPDPDWIYRWDLDAAMARVICEVAHWASAGDRRVIAVNLDGASAQVQNMLLKVVEEPPVTTRFVLAASARPLPTVLSRCRVLVLGRPRECATADARDVAAVGAAVKAAREMDSGQLAQAVRGWWKGAAPGQMPSPVRLLAVWAAEVVTGRWQVFTPDLVPGVSQAQALRLLAELERWQGARLGPVVALDRVFSQG